MQAAVGAVIVDVVVGMGMNICKKKQVLPILIMAGSFIAACVFGVNVVWIVLFCGALGAFCTLYRERKAKKGDGHDLP